MIEHAASRCFQSRPTADRGVPQLVARSHLNWQLRKRTGYTSATSWVNTSKSCAYGQNNGQTIDDCRKR